MTDYAKVNVYGNNAAGHRVLLVAKGNPVPVGVTVDSGDKTTDRAEAIGLPILGYDALEEADVLDRLEQLDADDQATIIAYERANQGREAILQFGADTDTRPVVLDTSMPATATAVDADQTIGEVPTDGKVIEVTYIPEAAVTGADTNSRTVRVVNKGQSGSGSTVIATLALTNAVNAAAFDEKAIPLTATVADRDVQAGDVLVWESTHVGTGLADPGGRVTVKIAAD